jgi:type IV secretion system protein VirB9
VPDSKAVTKADTASARPDDAELAAATDPSSVVDPVDLNFAWTGAGNNKLLPSRIYDDGVSTYLSWPAGSPLPAILVKDNQGTEGPVNFAVRGSVIVMDLVPKEIILRSGREMATIANNRPARASAALAQLDKVTK